MAASGTQHSSLSAFAPFIGALPCNRTVRALLHLLPTERFQKRIIGMLGDQVWTIQMLCTFQKDISILGVYNTLLREGVTSTFYLQTSPLMPEPRGTLFLQEYVFQKQEIEINGRPPATQFQQDPRTMVLDESTYIVILVWAL